MAAATPYLKIAFSWLLSWALFWSLIALVGGLLGVLVYTVFTPLFAPEWPWDRRLAKGFVNGFFYLGVVWGPGLAIVLCFVRGHRRNAARRAEEKSTGSHDGKGGMAS